MGNKFILDKVLESIAATREYIDVEEAKAIEKIYDEFLVAGKKFWFFGPVVTRSFAEAKEAALENEPAAYRIEYLKSKFEVWRNDIFWIEKVALALTDRCFTDINLTTEEFSNIWQFYKVD